MGSLLLSLHTFVIVNLKDKLFSTERYISNFKLSRNLPENEKVDECELFKPLDTLSSFINISVWLSILSAVSQFTIGLIDAGVASVFCIWLAMLTICFLLNSLILIRVHIKKCYINRFNLTSPCILNKSHRGLQLLPDGTIGTLPCLSNGTQRYSYNKMSNN